jgi:hypothetical protein
MSLLHENCTNTLRFIVLKGRGVPRILPGGMHIFGCPIPPPPPYFSNVALHWSSRRVGGDARASCSSPLGTPLLQGKLLSITVLLKKARSDMTLAMGNRAQVERIIHPSIYLRLTQLTFEKINV